MQTFLENILLGHHNLSNKDAKYKIKKYFLSECDG